MPNKKQGDFSLYYILMAICLCVTIASVLGFYEKWDGRPRQYIRAIKIKTRVCCFCFYTAIVIYSLCWQSQRLFILISFFLLVFDLAVTSEVKVKTEGDTMALYSRESCSTAGCASALALCWTTTRRHTGLIRPLLYQSLLHTYSYTELILTIFSYIISSLYLVFLFFLSALFFFFFLFFTSLFVIFVGFFGRRERATLSLLLCFFSLASRA
jgi:hypothetical protein